MFKERLKQYRKEKNLSQEKLAKKANVALNSIRRYEAGETTPTLDVAERLAAALEIEPENLLDFDSDIKEKFFSEMLHNAGYYVTDDGETHYIKEINTGKGKEISIDELDRIFNTAQTATETALKMQIDKYMRDDEKQN